MKNIRFLIALSLCIAGLEGCAKLFYNPKAIDVPEVPFEAVIHEQRYSKGINWTVDDKDRLSSDYAQSGELVATAWNSISISATSDADAFSGFNVSTDEGCVKVERVDNFNYNVLYKGDGQTVIRIWTGDENSPNARKFVLHARRCIPLEYLKFEYDSKILRFKPTPSEDANQYFYVKLERNLTEEQTALTGKVLTFLGPEPENTSWRLCSYADRWGLCRKSIEMERKYRPELKLKWFEGYTDRADWSEFYGYQILDYCPSFLFTIWVEYDGGSLINAKKTYLNLGALEDYIEPKK